MDTTTAVVDAFERAPRLGVPLVLHDFFHASRIEELLLKREWEPA
jgi:hypothetical protein